ncbi:hypothetical protein [Bacillus thuringiensis]|uniref:Uncharacterized protein n=1 Tax=Bacillus thuringiensis TaxID=1428 RepID=A0A9X6WHU7_BACTU|nr:hypothetical protein [Bacillus thuringiensis]PFJ31859.1 hypothetical protein COJ15_29610 [Bacillus thuringiensis]
MKLLKSKKSKEIMDDWFESSNFIQPYWYDILDDQNNKAGIITGYSLNIPFIMNDFTINNGSDSFFEFDGISQLCHYLWSFLSHNKSSFAGKNGNLYFLNNINLFDEKANISKEKEILDILLSKYDLIVYTNGSTEVFDDYFNKRDEGYWDEHEQMLLASGWECDEGYNFFIKENTGKSKRKSTISPTPDDSAENTPLEFWVKSKGLDWLNTLWDNTIKHSRFDKDWKKLKDFESPNYDFGVGSPGNKVRPINFIKKVEFVEFLQYDSESGYVCEAPPHAKGLRSEGIVAQYEGELYVIHFWQDYMDEEISEFVSFGHYNLEKNTFIFDGDTEPFNFTTASWVAEFFIHLFNRIYNEYKNQPKIKDNVISLYR